MEQQKKYDIFISYSRKDSVIADEICKAFDRVGITYFIDRKGMGGTANYVTKIAEEIDNSKAMLLLASANSYKSKYVSIELHYAFNHDVVVLPYALDETPVPKDFEILLIHANWHYFSEDPIIPTLLTSVSELVDKSITPIFTPELTPIPTPGPTPIPTPEPSPVPAPTPKPTPKPKSTHKPINKSWIWISVAAFAIIGLVIIGVRQVQQRSTILEPFDDIEILEPFDDIEQEKIVQDSLCQIYIQDSIAKEQVKQDALPKGKFQVGDLMYKASKKGSGVTVVNPINEEVSEIRIPSQIKYGNYTYDVMSIGVRAFVSCHGLKSITIPNSVTSIGDYAFDDCSALKSIRVPKSLTNIGAAFPKGVEVIRE